MTATDDPCALQLSQAQIAADRLTAEQRRLLQAAFAFQQRCGGDDYYSGRLLSPFLPHCDSGLKVAQIARLVGISRSMASHQQGISSKEAIQAAHHRLAGRPPGKLLPRYAGPIAEFIPTHCDAAVAFNPDVLVLCHGGPITEPADAAYVLQRTRGVVGFFGASSIERLPTETAITARVREFKGIAIRK